MDDRGDDMPVSGIVVRCLDGCADTVAGRIAAFEGVEVHGVLPDGQIVAVVEADTVQEEKLNLWHLRNDHFAWLGSA